MLSRVPGENGDVGYSGFITSRRTTTTDPGEDFPCGVNIFCEVFRWLANSGHQQAPPHGTSCSGTTSLQPSSTFPCISVQAVRVPRNAEESKNVTFHDVSGRTRATEFDNFWQRPRSDRHNHHFEQVSKTDEHFLNTRFN